MSSFHEISLSRNELRLLSRFDKEGQLAETDCQKESVTRLCNFKLVRKLWFDLPGKENGLAYEITNLGHDFLMFNKSKAKDKRYENIRYSITTAIAVIALIISIIK